MRTRPLLLILLTFAFAGTYGCGDDVTDPDAFLESAEAEAVMRSADALPMLPELVATASVSTDRERAVLLRARELWAAGTVDDGRASARRRLAVGYALPILAESLTEDDWGELRARMEDWIGTVESMTQHLSLPAVEEHTSSARRYLARAAVADHERRRGYYLLLGLSDLVETTPRFVAVRMVREARVALAATDGEAPDRTIERAQRLKDWAEQAVQEEDYLLAIQRAYYAVQLVEGA
ncbi:MAG: hypothetical protein R3314_04045 [Longimicrobiales bacterium]|nr:hypothetical protein [Longimicrobiales bacterium]